jgi:protein SCO1/2
MNIRRQIAKFSNKHVLFFYFSIGLLVLLVVSACAPQLKGTDLGKEPAPDFQLSDHRGGKVSLADLRGKIVVLTFLYTHCTDECPLIAEHLRATADQLGNAMAQVAFIAVSVDPEHDTPDAVQQFLADHQLDGRLRYLIGSRQQLQPIWSAYFVAVQPGSGGEPSVDHSIRLIVIDKNGKQRVNFDGDADPQDLVFDIRALLRE